MSSLSHRVGTQAPTVYAHYDFFSKLITWKNTFLFVIDMVFSKFINLLQVAQALYAQNVIV